MKIAIISDIHSNLEALRACVNKADSSGAEQYVCLGDAIGYGPDPVATIELIRSLPNIIMIKGNHEEALFGSYYKGLRQHIRSTIDWTREQLSEEQQAFLQQLPYQHELLNITLVHATASKPDKWDYVYNNEEAHECIVASAKPLTFIGHTHQPQVYYETPTGKIKCLTPEVEMAIPIYQRGRYVINVGSVGQPRDENSAASFVIYDSVEREVTFYRVAYDYNTTAQKIIDRGLPHLFADRLKTGN